MSGKQMFQTDWAEIRALEVSRATVERLMEREIGEEGWHIIEITMPEEDWVFVGVVHPHADGKEYLERHLRIARAKQQTPAS